MKARNWRESSTGSLWGILTGGYTVITKVTRFLIEQGKTGNLQTPANNNRIERMNGTQQERIRYNEVGEIGNTKPFRANSCVMINIMHR
jgi:hypothetical protein